MRKKRTIRNRPNSAMKWQLTLAGAAVMLAVFLLIPLILVNKFEEWDKAAQTILPLQPQEKLVQVEEGIAIPVFLTGEKTTVSIPLEEYVRGVLAAEMPAEFEHEALKAQAIAARTYIVRRLADGDRSSMPEGANQAIVTDTVVHQAYLTEQKLRDRWGLFAYGRNIDKLTKAVNETKGLIITYEGMPIHATFFSTSDGFTEDSENYWSQQVPYLRSVESPWDRLYSPKFKSTTVINRSEVYRRLGLSETKGQLGFKVIERSPTGKIMKIEAGGKLFLGREFREKLELPSTNFTWTLKGKALEFTSTGFGHGVGMSQWGANGMAKQGKSAEDILHYYYTGVHIVPLNNVLPSKTIS